MPEDAMYVGRPTRWGNPISAKYGITSGPSWADIRGKPMQTGVWPCEEAVIYAMSAPRELAAEHAVDIFRTYCEVQQRDYPDTFAEWIAPLTGKDLCCWCPVDAACHADVLLALANSTVGVGL